MKRRTLIFVAAALAAGLAVGAAAKTPTEPCQQLLAAGDHLAAQAAIDAGLLNDIAEASFDDLNLGFLTAAAHNRSPALQAAVDAWENHRETC